MNAFFDKHQGRPARRIEEAKKAIAERPTQLYGVVG